MGREQYLDSVVVLIPSLDPDCEMVKYVKGLLEKGFRKIIIVDDGSKKENRKFFEEAGESCEVTVLRHVVNQGKGRALKTGFNYILDNFAKEETAGVVTADADGQHSVEDTARVAQRLAESGKLVLGTRNFKEPDVPFKSRSGNRLTTIVFALLYGKRIGDTQTGLRGIPWSFMQRCLGIEGERFEYETLMLIDAVRSGLDIVEEPIQTIYIDSNRATHFHVVRDSVRIYRVILSCFLKYTLSGLLSFFVDISVFAFLTKILFSSLDVTLGTFLGTLLARMVSSFLNYSLNKQTVFNDGRKMGSSLFKYYILCVLQLLCSWGLVVAVFDRVHWDTTLIKGLVDIVLFFISFQIQRLWVFGRERE